MPGLVRRLSLKVGDNLRRNVEKGLKECKRCVLIITKNFLTNDGWTKREFDSIFTRELIERNSVILPVWHEVSPQDVYQYSPSLADRLAVKWELGVEEVSPVSWLPQCSRRHPKGDRQESRDRPHCSRDTGTGC